MIPRSIGLAFIVFSGCAGARSNLSATTLNSTERSPGLFMGHSQSGDVVVAATHYDAMSGLATTDADLGLPARKNQDGRMLCRREVLTGTHLPRWTCRYVAEIERDRQLAQDFLDETRLNLASARLLPPISMGRGPGHTNNHGSLTP